MSAYELARKSFEVHIRENTYPGRGLIIGRAMDGERWLMVYWIMGRSASSRNRHFVASEGGVLRTEPVDTSHMERPELLIYEAMLELPQIYLVSNGDQTRTIYDTLLAGGSFEGALALREREPDAPHYTPRISGMLTLKQGGADVVLSILKANRLDPAHTDRTMYHSALPVVGVGVGLTTYAGDGNPLPSFAGDPVLLPLVGSPEEVLETYWDGLNSEHRIALAVKVISTSGEASRLLVRNRFA